MTQAEMIKPTLSTIDAKKFHVNGQPKIYPGSTIISHLPQEGPNSELFTTLLDVYRNLVSFDFCVKDKMILLPTSSYHMTIVSCSDIIIRPTKVESFEVDTHANETLTQVAKCLKEKLQVDSKSFPIRLKATELLIAEGAGLTLIIEPFPETKEFLTEIRQTVGDILGVKINPDHRFHVTLGYFVDEFSDKEFIDFKKMLAVLNKQFIKKQIVQFDQMEFCFFKDMFQFQVQQIYK